MNKSRGKKGVTNMSKKHMLTGREKLAIIVLVILTIVFFANLSLFLNDIDRHKYDYTNELSTLHETFSRGDYSQLIELVAQNRGRGLTPYKDTSEYENFADYVAAESLYITYAASGEAFSSLTAKYQSLADTYYNKITRETMREAADAIAAGYENYLE